MDNLNDKLSNEAQNQPSCLGAVMRSCVHCGNKKDFKTWTELEYDDGRDEPTTGNHLINVEFVKCLKCGEVL
mgnify:CR=1 FL=1